MTRRVVYGIGMLGFLAAIAMTIASIIIPEWISWNVESSSGGSKPVHYSYGLHAQCSSLDKECKPFPRYDECQGSDRHFCSLWRTTGFLMNFAVVAELATLSAYLVVVLGGKQRRQTGWRVVVALLVLSAAVQTAAAGIVGHVFRNDARFIDWTLAKAYYLCISSLVTLVVVALATTSAALALPEEGGYELIPPE